mmetsp:Transcript_16205/g.52791  ORF Transcript_16205/g.52791 Transcript_16205/m.52791 type:complete len:236 (-) Transcript_16205:35-742(-)
MWLSSLTGASRGARTASASDTWRQRRRWEARSVSSATATSSRSTQKRSRSRSTCPTPRWLRAGRRGRHPLTSTRAAPCTVTSRPSRPLSRVASPMSRRHAGAHQNCLAPAPRHRALPVGWVTAIFYHWAESSQSRSLIRSESRLSVRLPSDASHPRMHRFLVVSFLCFSSTTTHTTARTTKTTRAFVLRSHISARAHVDPSILTTMVAHHTIGVQRTAGAAQTCVAVVAVCVHGM